MSSDRRQQLWRLVTDHALREKVSVSPTLVCAVCATTLELTGAGVSVMTSPRQREAVTSTTELGSRLDELELTLGEGPCVEAFESGGPILVDDLSAMTHASRWPAFARAASEVGVGALFAFPLVSGGIRLGVMKLYRDREGELDATQFADALVFVDLALLLLVSTQDGGHPDALGSPQDALSAPQAEVYQAMGMVSVQLGVSLSEAFARMRGQAFVSDVGISEVAHYVVSRRLRFEPEENT